MKNLVLGLLLLLCCVIPLAQAQDKADGVRGSVEGAAFGGTWHRPDGFGQYRLLVVRTGWAEKSSYEVFLQWLRVDHEQGERIVDHSVCIAEIAEIGSCRITESPRFNANASIHSKGKFEVVVMPKFGGSTAYYTITPRADKTYSVVRSSAFHRRLLSAPMICGSIGFFIGIFLTYIKMRYYTFRET